MQGDAGKCFDFWVAFSFYVNFLGPFPKNMNLTDVRAIQLVLKEKLHYVRWRKVYRSTLTGHYPFHEDGVRGFEECPSGKMMMNEPN